MAKEPIEVKDQDLKVIRAPQEVISEAIAKGVNLKEIGELMTYQERWEATQSKKLYNANMVKVQKEIPVVAKSLKNSQTNSKYASLDDIIFETKKIYTAHGFSITFYEGETVKPGHIRICADVVHESGHKEAYYYDVPLDGVGIKGNANMTAIHAKASSTSYAHRYLMCLIWNIPTGDDDDAQAAGTIYIDDKEKGQIVDMLSAKNVKIDFFCSKFNIETLEKLPKEKFKQAIAALTAKKVAK